MIFNDMKIAYVTGGDPRDIRTWSGLSYYIAESLKWQGAEIAYLGPLVTEESLLLRAKRIAKLRKKEKKKKKKKKKKSLA